MLRLNTPPSGSSLWFSCCMGFLCGVGWVGVFCFWRSFLACFLGAAGFVGIIFVIKESGGFFWRGSVGEVL